MNAIRSLLWIGRAETFPATLASEAPTLDLVWEPDFSRAGSLDRAAFDAVVVDADDAAHALAALRGLGRARVLVRIDSAEAHHRDALLAAGATEVRLRSSTEDDADRAALLATLVALAERPRGPRFADPDQRRRFAPEIIGDSPALQRVLALAERASRSRATVLLTGETGTGKELIARAIHRGSPRCDLPFVAINCAALPDTLLESELLGHVRGAFTGAERDRRGLIEEADSGTLFLDEIGETSPGFQAKLLRVLQERAVRPVGGSRVRQVDVRIVAATNRELRREVAERRFREDLWYRLAVFPIALPPLRERPGDVEIVAQHLLARCGEEESVKDCRLSPDAMRLLQSHRWPGNVRELENEIRRALALAEPGSELSPEHFSERLRNALQPVDSLPAELSADESLRDTLGRLEAWLIRRALESHGGHRADTARRLGLTREGLYKKMKRLGIE